MYRKGRKVDHLPLVMWSLHLQFGRLEARSDPLLVTTNRDIIYSFAFGGKLLRRLSLRLSLPIHDALHQVVYHVSASLE